MGDELIKSITKDIQDNKKWGVIIIFILCSIIPGALFLGFLYPSFVKDSDIFKILLFSCAITLPLTGVNLFIDSASKLYFEEKEIDFDFMLIGALVVQSSMTIVTVMILSTMSYYCFCFNEYIIYTWHLIFWPLIYIVERYITRKLLKKKK